MKKTIALPMPTSARSFSTSAAGAHSGPMSAIRKSLQAAITAIAGTVRMSVVRMHDATASLSAGRSSWSREKNGSDT